MTWAPSERTPAPCACCPSERSSSLRSFWWLDDEPKWVARILYEHSTTRMERGLAFARWAGIGSHRYPYAAAATFAVEL